MQSERVVFLLSGPAHLPYLVVSLNTLRQYHSGNVFVYAWPESVDIVRRMAEDRRLFIDSVVERVPEQRGRNAQFLDKIRLARSIGREVEKLIYLDADTTIHGSIQPLYTALEYTTFAATQFCDWLSTGGIVSRRLEKLKEVRAMNITAVDVLTTHPFPSVNGGVWSTRPDNVVLQLWEELTLAAKEHVFIADEAVLHLMQVIFGPTECTVLQDRGKWNCSPKYQSNMLADDEVVVRHYHGDSNVRPDKSQKGYEMWWPLWQQALEDNLGGCTEWWPAVQAGPLNNKWMRKIEEMQTER
jgi:hypothetical protein